MRKSAATTSIGLACAAVLVLAASAIAASGGVAGAGRRGLSQQAHSRNVESQPSTAGAVPSWFSYHRSATSGIRSKMMRVPMRDGTRLGCTVLRPVANRPQTPTRAPVIVMNFWPYYSHTTLSYELPYARYFATRGYAVLVCAMRGTYDSAGKFPGWWTASDARDNYDLVEWASRQPWSSGRVGETGVSYAGVNTLKVAAMRPPHLVAIVPQFAFHNAYLDYFYPGGIANDVSQSPAPGVSAYRGVTPAEEDSVWSTHTLDDAYWRNASVPTSRIRVPTLFIGGWQDYMVTGDIANYHALDRPDAWLVMGPWEHGITPPSLTSPMQLAWFDHWLMRLPLAPLPSARVTSFEMPGDTESRWTEMSSYPPADAVHLRFDLTANHALDPEPGPAGLASYVVDAHDGPPAICFPPGQPPCDPSSDMAGADARRLTFTTAPLEKPLVVLGSMQVHLRAALSSTDGNLVVKVMDVAPDGQVHQASVGYLKASHRLSQSHPTPLAPNSSTDFVISVWPMDWRFAPGHRLRLSFTSGDYPKIAPDAPEGTITIAVGEGGSYVDLRAR